MTQNKEIKFSTSTDTKGLDQLTEKLKKLLQVADQVAARFQKVKLGSGTRNDDLSNVVKGTTAEMGKLRLESIKTAETMSDRLGRAVLTNTQQIRQQTREFQHASRAARDFGQQTVQSASRLGVSVGRGANMGASMGAGQMMGATTGMSGGYGYYAGNGGRGGIGGGGIPPWKGSPWSQPSPFYERPSAQQAINTGQGVINAAGIANDVAGKYGQYEQSTAMMGLSNLARSQGYRQDLYRLATSAPVGYGAFVLGHSTAFASGENGSARDAAAEAMAGDPSKIARDRAGTGASLVSNITQQVMKGKGISANSDMATVPLQMVGKAGDALGNVVKGNWTQAGRQASQVVTGGFDSSALNTSIRAGGMNADQSDVMRNVLGTLQQVVGPQAQAAFGSIQSYAPLLASSSRMNGGRGRQAMGMGAGAGYDVGSSAAVMSSLGQHFGSSAVMGGLGQSAFSMSRKGMDAGVAGSIMGQIQMGGGDGQQVLERIFSKGVKQGMDSLDMRFFEKIGGAVAENAITQSGSVSGGNMPEALMFGLNNKSSMADVQGNIAGMNYMNSLSTNNSFFSSRSMAMAAEALGPKASGIGVQALNDTNITDLMSDKNEYLDNLGIDKDVRKKFGQDRMELIGKTLAGGGAGDGPEAKRIAAGMEQYGSFQQYMEKGGKKERGFVSSVAKTVFGDADYNTFEGMFNYIGGSGQKGGSGKGKSALNDVVDGQAVTNIATQTKMIFKQFENVNKILESIVKGSNGAVKNIGEAYGMLSKATVDMQDKTMGVGEENYGSSSAAADSVAGAAGGIGRLGTIADDTAAALSRLYGVAAAAAASRAAVQPKPNTAKPITKPDRGGGHTR